MIVKDFECPNCKYVILDNLVRKDDIVICEKCGEKMNMLPSATRQKPIIK